MSTVSPAIREAREYAAHALQCALQCAHKGTTETAEASKYAADMAWEAVKIMSTTTDPDEIDTLLDRAHLSANTARIFMVQSLGLSGGYHA